jgi:hypothetical protein
MSVARRLSGHIVDGGALSSCYSLVSSGGPFLAMDRLSHSSADLVRSFPSFR